MSQQTSDKHAAGHNIEPAKAIINSGDGEIPLYASPHGKEPQQAVNVLAQGNQQNESARAPGAPGETANALQDEGETDFSKIQQSSIVISNRIELAWRHLTIDVEVEVPAKTGKPGTMEKVRKVILNDLKGCLRPGEFTAILGPSGSGKTTLLNLLSGRLTSANMAISGELYLNSQRIPSIERYSNLVAYVMQDDILLATFTPREAFMFVTNLRLPHLSPEERGARVDNLIRELGLTKCAHTYVGNQFIRGISGGERKRTSIGVELLTNPSMIFLDEPTTGLDSSTAYNVIELLRHLSRQGVNVVSTIHQPSSEIFALFHKLLLIVRGNIIYHGDAQTAVQYFGSHGFRIPPYQNPSDFFMKLMNEEGLMIEKLQNNEELPPDEDIEKEFCNRLDKFISLYRTTPMYSTMQEMQLTDRIQENRTDYNVGYLTQFWLLISRAFTNEMRNPNIVRLKFIQQIVFAIACIIVFHNLEDPEVNGRAAIQNRSGVLFFLVTMQAFGSFQDSLAIFAEERNLFLRERLNGSYSVGSYFWGKSLAEFPFQLLYPTVAVTIAYFAVHLQETAEKFWICVLANVLTYWTGTSYGLLVSVTIPNPELALAMVPLLVIPLMVLGGLFVDTNQIPNWLKWLEYVSMFKYGFQSSVWNEFEGLNFNCQCVQKDLSDGQYIGIRDQYMQQTGITDVNDPRLNCIPVPCDPLREYGFNESLWTSMWAQFILGLAMRILALIGMYVISNPKRPVIQDPSTQIANKKDEAQKQLLPAEKN